MQLLCDIVEATNVRVSQSKVITKEEMVTHYMFKS